MTSCKESKSPSVYYTGLSSQQGKPNGPPFVYGWAQWPWTCSVVSLMDLLWSNSFLASSTTILLLLPKKKTTILLVPLFADLCWLTDQIKTNDLCWFLGEWIQPYVQKDSWGLHSTIHAERSISFAPLQGMRPQSRWANICSCWSAVN